MQHYIFHELGSIPGIPGSFGHCCVTIDDEGNLTELPLAPIASEVPTEAPTGEAVPEPIEEEATVVQEPVVPSVPYSPIGG